ncbi:MAG TPA: tRNA adenosine(34) deaminase TadA [Clostridia bacterium]|nr:tRNA adenosine(34) deaminase TadA [Clostridia bacterium]
MLDEKFMLQALKEAQKAYDLDEVPIGAVIVKDGKIIARGHNLKEREYNPILHAEIVAITNACKKIGSWRLTGCEIYVTIEPCAMCAGALVQGRLDRVIFGARDSKAGCTGSLYNLVQDPRFNHQLDIVEGVLEEDCRQIMQDFFRYRRMKGI